MGDWNEQGIRGSSCFWKGGYPRIQAGGYSKVRLPTARAFSRCLPRARAKSDISVVRLTELVLLKAARNAEWCIGRRPGKEILNEVEDRFNRRNILSWSAFTLPQLYSVFFNVHYTVPFHPLDFLDFENWRRRVGQAISRLDMEPGTANPLPRFPIFEFQLVISCFMLSFFSSSIISSVTFFLSFEILFHCCLCFVCCAKQI